MSDVDFYNRNCYRMYPFTNGTYDSPAVQPWLVADMGIVLYDWLEFDTANVNHRVVPSSITLEESGRYLFSFVIVVDGYINPWIVGALARPVGEAVNKFDVLTETLPSSAIGVGSSGTRPTGYIWLVVGDIERAIVHTGAQSWDINGDDRAVLQRCKLQWQKGHYVDSFSLRNERRLLAVSPCNSSSTADENYPSVPNGARLQGNVRFVEGYNCGITTLPQVNALKFDALRGAGMGEACEEVPRTWYEEQQVAQGKLLDHAIRCDDAVSFIGGVEPDTSGRFTLSAGKGVNIIAKPEQHRIKIRARRDISNCGVP